MLEEQHIPFLHHNVSVPTGKSMYVLSLYQVSKYLFYRFYVHFQALSGENIKYILVIYMYPTRGRYIMYKRIHIYIYVCVCVCTCVSNLWKPFNRLYKNIHNIMYTFVQPNMFFLDKI